MSPTIIMNGGFEMDWSILVGIGTIILAIATISYVAQSKRQTDILYRQINLQMGLQIPRLLIKNVIFEPNSIKIDIQNITRVPAYWVGLETRFFVIGQRLFASQKTDSEISWGEAVKLKGQGKQIYAKYYWPGSSPKLKYKDAEVDNDGGISFFSPQGVSVYFPPNSLLQIKTTPRFAVSWKQKSGLPASQGFEYKDFRDFLLANDVKAVAVIMALFCKDSAENVHSQGYAASFAIRTDLDQSLVDSSKNAQRFDFIPLSHEEILSEKSWTTYEQYKNTYSNWHIF